MDKSKIWKLVTRFIGPMIIGSIIALVNIKLVEMGVASDVTVVKVLYTFSSNFIGFLKWFAPFMSLVLIATGVMHIKGQVINFLTRFTVTLLVSISLIGIITIILSYLIVPLYVMPFELGDSMWPDVYFTINFPQYLGIFQALVIGIILGIIAQYINRLEIILNKLELFIGYVVKYIIIPLSPFWIMGSFAGSTYSSQGLEIVWFDLWLSLIILVIQFGWLGFMYGVASKYSGIAFSKIVKAAIRIYVIVLSMAGMTNTAIYPFLVEEQEELGLNVDKAKFVTVSSFNMPGSLIAHIVFAYGLALLFKLDISFLQMLEFSIVLSFVLVVSPAISGGVFAITSSLLAPMLGFTDPMIGLMSSMYFKQGTSNAAVNNCADFYITTLSMNRSEFETRDKQ